MPLYVSFGSLEEINREYSYSFGDAVILNLADCLQQVFNSDEDVIARISSNCFLTGYSSLSLLGGLPPDTLKIDCELLWESLTSQCKGKIIKYVVSMAKDIGFDVICEGVENQTRLICISQSAATKLRVSFLGARRQLMILALRSKNKLKKGIDKLSISCYNVMVAPSVTLI